LTGPAINPLNSTIRSGSASEAFRVRLFSRAQKMQAPTIATRHTILSGVGESDHARRTHSERDRAAQAPPHIASYRGSAGFGRCWGEADINRQSRSTGSVENALMRTSSSNCLPRLRSGAAQNFQFALPKLCFQSLITPGGNSRVPTPVRRQASGHISSKK